ncbi:MAG: hypothetical protein HRT45_01195 [Bdellovibrionales bacterium]|nr:hypothetical protein [Bdellovibrionales bacterium]
MKKKSKKKDIKNIPLWARTGHRKPVTRREFLASGIIPFAAQLALPGVASLLTSEVAKACVGSSSAVDTSMCPFVHIHLAGGAGLGSNYVPLDKSGNFLPSYNKLGLGRAPDTATLFQGAPFHTKSELYKSLKDEVTGSVERATTFLAIPNQSRDDFSENAFGLAGLINRSGIAKGSLFANLATVKSPSGGFHTPALFPPLAAPYVVSKFGDIVEAISYTDHLKTLSQGQKQKLSKLISNLSSTQQASFNRLPASLQASELFGCVSKENEALIASGGGDIDPFKRKDMRELWPSPSAQDHLIAGMVYNALQYQSGVVDIHLGGYDYHDGTRYTMQDKDSAVGKILGRILKMAEMMNQDLFIYVTTDGAVGSPISNSDEVEFTLDRGISSVAYALAYSSSGTRHPTKNNAFQLGSFNNEQAVDTSFVASANPAQCSISVFANYLLFNKQPHLFEKVARGSISDGDVKVVSVFEES